MTLRLWSSAHGARWAGVAAVVLVGSMALGSVLGASALFGPGSTEDGQGAYVSESTPAYWTWQETLRGTIPAPVPAAVSLAAHVPTLLPALATAYRLAPATAGNNSVRWVFQEATTTPRLTELELRFTVGVAGSTVKITAYVESATTVLGAALDFTFYWDAGTAGPTAVTVATMQATVLVCTAVGVCP